MDVDSADDDRRQSRSRSPRRRSRSRSARSGGESESDHGGRRHKSLRSKSPLKSPDAKFQRRDEYNNRSRSHDKRPSFRIAHSSVPLLKKFGSSPNGGGPSVSVLPATCELIDPDLPPVNDDPRRIHNLNLKGLVQNGGAARNAFSFDPNTTVVRPEMRIRFGSTSEQQYAKTMKHDDVIVVPELFCEEGDTSIYYQLLKEIRDTARNDTEVWEPWHEGCHLATKSAHRSPTFQAILEKVTQYFGLTEGSQFVRFNWYRDSSDWKPFHHDSAAFNPDRARNQNITIGVSFGAERELAFLHAQNHTKVYFPQTNGMACAFGKDVNINWKHGINALPKSEQSGRGRISIIIWGWCSKFTAEQGSPPMLPNTNERVAQQQQQERNPPLWQNKRTIPIGKPMDKPFQPHGRQNDYYHNNRNNSNEHDRPHHKRYDKFRHGDKSHRDHHGHNNHRDNNHRDRNNHRGGRDDSGRKHDRQGTVLCRNFTAGSCSFGANCRFSHDPNDPNVAPSAPQRNTHYQGRKSHHHQHRNRHDNKVDREE